MKGNKSLTYLLITGVLLVWGIIFYRIFLATSENDVDAPLNRALPSLSTSVVSKDSFQLVLNYRDPFLSGIARAHTPSADSPRSNTKTAGTTVRTDWAIISYLGLVSNKANKKRIGLALINNREHMIQEGMVIDSITFLKNREDSIYVMYKKQKRWIRRK